MPSKNRKLFLTDHCLTPHENIPSGAILCDRDKIIATGGASAFVREPGLEVIEMEDTYAVPGFIGSSGLVGCGKIHWLMEAFFRARSSAATLSGRMIVRLPWLVFVSPRA